MIRCAILAAALTCPPAHAAVLCTFNSTPGMAFGVYDDSSAAATTGATTIVARCFRAGGASNVDITLQLGASGTSGGIANRQMASGGERLDYNLYRDAARTLVWGQTAGTDAVTVTVSGIPNNSSRDASFTIYGRIPAQQNLPAGVYTDSVQITVSP